MYTYRFDKAFKGLWAANIVNEEESAMQLCMLEFLSPYVL